MNYLEKYSYNPDETQLFNKIQSVISNVEVMKSADVLMKCFSLMDLTTLHPNDTESSVVKLVDKVNRLRIEYPDYPLPASICVYPNFASVIRDRRADSRLHVTTVAGCFPTSQSFPEVKVRECELAVENGADEVDIVLALNKFLAGDYDGAFAEIRDIRSAVDAVASRLGRKVILKVILETGLLRSVENIANASFLAMEAGADFIKTSTGKVDVNATPTAAWVMCECIRRYYEQTGRKVGFKAAGGISNEQDALGYYYIGQTVLGGEWMSKEFFRFGVSRLGNSLMSAVEQRTVVYF